jgi:hypothetical protein
MVVGERSVDDDVGLDHSWQYFHERPAADDDEDEDDPDDDVDELDQAAEDVVYATDPGTKGELRAENVPIPDSGERPDRDGQTTIDDWRGWSA